MAKKNNNINLPKKHSYSNKTFRNIKKLFVSHNIRLGAYFFHLIDAVLRKFAQESLKRIDFLKKNVPLLFNTIKNSVKKCCSALFNPIITALSNFKVFATDVSNVNEQYDGFKAFKYAIVLISKTFWKNKNKLVTIANYTAPAIALVFLVNLISLGTKTEYALGIEYDGQVLGYVNEEADYTQAQQLMQDRITYVDGDSEITIEPRLSVKKISVDQKINTVDEITDKMISHSDTAVVDAFGIYINGEFIGATQSVDNVSNLLEKTLGKYETYSTTDTVSFVNDIQIKNGLYIEDGLIPEQSLISILTDENYEQNYYIASEEESVSSIAENFGITYSEIKELNPDLEEKSVVGQRILTKKTAPLLSVKVVSTQVYPSAIAFETTSVDDPSAYKGDETVLIEGVEGEEIITAEVTFVDGIETIRNVISTQLVREPVTEKISVGVKATGYSDAAWEVSDGGFLWPVGNSGGRVTSNFGWRTYQGERDWHQGIDIAAPYGTPIFAAADGVITTAVTQNYGYGYHLIVDHGKGYSTLYGHCSKFLVRSGDKVKKGDVIAYMGSTGNSSGNHVHFEVREWGEKLNPAKFIKK